jgi:hypothetical protein
MHKENVVMYILFSLALTYSIYATAACEKYGLVITPVADLIGQPIHKTDCTYENLPVAGSDQRCPRLHQILFNETVEIIEQTDEEYRIRISSVFYITPKNNSRQNSYWTNKKNIMPLTKITNKQIDQFIPTPIDFRYSEKNSHQTIVLIKPWSGSMLNMTFSAGTRFVAVKPHSRTHFNISVLHPEKNRIITGKIPQSYAILEDNRSPEEARSIFNKLLKTWAHTKGFIPYVWGGCSFCYTHSQTSDFYTNEDENKKMYRIAGDTHIPKSGFDCAGLIARAAQIAGMPYYYKNTATLATYLKPVKTYNDLKEGDLIWIPGHVMAVGNIKKGTIIEAAHYSKGYGKIHEIPLHKIFRNIHTFRCLFHAMQQKKTFERIDKNERLVQEIRNLKILSIS